MNMYAADYRRISNCCSIVETVKYPYFTSSHLPNLNSIFGRVVLHVVALVYNSFMRLSIPEGLSRIFLETAFSNWNINVIQIKVAVTHFGLLKNRADTSVEAKYTPFLFIKTLKCLYLLCPNTKVT